MKLKLKFDGPAIALSLAAILILAIKISLVSPATFCLLTISLMLVCLFREIYTPALALSSTVVILLLGSKANTQTVTEVVNGVQLSSSNFLPLEKAFLGFSNSAVITIGSLFVVAAAVRNTGAINLLATRLLHKAESIGGALQRMALPLMALSAVFNNTPIVAIFIPSVRDWALRNKISPSKILLPLVYLTSFGGLFTIIGTSTNYFINNQVIGQGLEGFAMFEFSKLAIPAAILGFIYLFTIGHRLLPENEDLVQAEKSNTRKYLVEMSLENGSLLNHKTIAASGLRNLPDIFLFAVRRNGEFISPVQDSFQLNINDRLVFTGEHNNLLKLKKINGLSSPVFCNSPELEENSQLIEVIIPNTSALIGKTIEELWFNQRYDATVIALHRNGENIDSTVAQTPLKSGDTMLMITGSNYSDVWKTSRDFYFVSGVERQQMNALTPSTTLTLITSILMVLLPTFNILGIEYTSIIAAIVITVIKKSRNIFMQLDWDVLIVIGAAFGISRAFNASGAADIIAQYTGSLSSSFGPIGALFFIYLISNVLTELITNIAAAALMLPIAISTADVLGASPTPFIIAVAFAASASFSTPIGYQTNMMVYGPGGYKFKDYLRIGLPLNLIYALTTTLLAPQIWPF